MKPEGKTLHGKPRRGWENNIKMDLIKMDLWGVNSIYPAKNRDQWRLLVNTVINIWVPYKVGFFYNLSVLLSAS